MFGFWTSQVACNSLAGPDVTGRRSASDERANAAALRLQTGIRSFLLRQVAHLQRERKHETTLANKILLPWRLYRCRGAAKKALRKKSAIVI